jgi:hypothetical protein
MLNLFRKSNTYNTRKKVLNRIIFHSDKLFFQTSIRHNKDDYKSNGSKKSKGNENNDYKNSTSKKANNKFNRFSFIELEKKTFESSLKRDRYDSTFKKNSKRIDSSEFDQKNKNDDTNKIIDEAKIKKTAEVNHTDTGSALDILAFLINKFNKEEEVDNLLKPIKSTTSESIKINESENKNNKLIDHEHSINIKETKLELEKWDIKIERVIDTDKTEIYLKNSDNKFKRVLDKRKTELNETNGEKLGNLDFNSTSELKEIFVNKPIKPRL